MTSRKTGWNPTTESRVDGQKSAESRHERQAPDKVGVPSVVAIGGGHGLASTLRALRRLPVWPVAVVSVADDGGSTGRLRSDAERVAPGDIRKCLGALAAQPVPSPG